MSQVREFAQQLAREGIEGLEFLDAVEIAEVDHPDLTELDIVRAFELARQAEVVLPDE